MIPFIDSSIPMRSFACMKNILLYRIASAALFYCPALLPRCAKRGTVSRAVPILVYKALFSSVCPAFPPPGSPEISQALYISL